MYMTVNPMPNEIYSNVIYVCMYIYIYIYMITSVQNAL